MPDGDIIPIDPGFQFECQRCGKCCEKNVVLNELEALYLIELGIKIKYTAIFSKAGRIISLFPSKPPGLCPAYNTETRKCMIYPMRSGNCKMFPMIMRIYHNTPPTVQEILRGLRLPLNHKGPLRHFVHKLDGNRWVFLGCTPDKNCPGIGKGPYWSEYDIKRFIAHNIFTYENGMTESGETSQHLIDYFPITNEKSMSVYFELEEKIFEDDDTVMNLYGAKNGLPDINSNINLTVDICGTNKLGRPL